MASLRIREYTRLADVTTAQLAHENGATDQAVITLSGSSQQSAAFAAGTRYIGITADGIYAFVVGDNPTASATASMRIADLVSPFFMGVKGGQKVAVITST